MQIEKKKKITFTLLLSSTKIHLIQKSNLVLWKNGTPVKRKPWNMRPIISFSSICFSFLKFSQQTKQKARNSTWTVVGSTEVLCNFWSRNSEKETHETLFVALSLTSSLPFLELTIHTKNIAKKKIQSSNLWAQNQLTKKEEERVRCFLTGSKSERGMMKQ